MKRHFEECIFLVIILFSAGLIFVMMEPKMNYEEHSALMTALNEYVCEQNGEDAGEWTSNGTVYLKEENDDGTVIYYLRHLRENDFTSPPSGSSFLVAVTVSWEDETAAVLEYRWPDSEVFDIEALFSKKAMRRMEKNRTITDSEVYEKWEEAESIRVNNL